MKKHTLSLAALSALAGLALAAPAHAATGYVVVVAEGVSPQIVQTGKSYLQKADEDAELTTAFEEIVKYGKSAPVGAGVIGELKGLLETAENNGFKTGLVTTGDVSQVAPLFYDLGADPVAALTAKGAKYDFLAGGGRAKFGDAGEALKAAGGTFISTSAALDEEVTGRLLVTQTDADLSYNLDHDPEAESSLSELASLALDTLGADEKPFVLIVHDTLVKKALATKDTPAFFEQLREVNNVLTDVISRREDDANLKIAAITTGGELAPQFQPGADAGQAYFTISNLGRSYVATGTALKGADNEKIAAFLDPEEGQYRGWKLSATDRAAIIAGTLSAETAARANYEPYLKLDFVAQTSAPLAYTAGFEAPGGLVEALKAVVSKPAA